MQNYYMNTNDMWDKISTITNLKPMDNAQQFNLTAINKKRRKDVDTANYTS